MNTKNRTWTGTLQRPTDFIDFSSCEHTDVCTCPKKIEIPLRTVDGRTVVAKVTPDEAEAFARQILLAVEFARS